MNPAALFRNAVAAALTVGLLVACGEPTPQGAKPQAIQPAAQSAKGFEKASVCSDKTEAMEFHDKAPQKTAGKYIHEVLRTDLEDAKNKIGKLPLPQSTPDWAECLTVEILYETSDSIGASKATAGGVQITAYDGEASIAAARAILYKVSFPLLGTEPAPPGEWIPIAGREGWFQDASASGEGATGVRIGWSHADSYWLELAGPFTLEEALRIADSVS